LCVVTYTTVYRRSLLRSADASQGVESSALLQRQCICGKAFALSILLNEVEVFIFLDETISITISFGKIRPATEEIDVIAIT
jgi:hypothetical protein